jgi:hypothetical protein
MKTTSMMAVALAFLCVSTMAFAKTHKSGTGTPPAHHCQLNGAEVQKTKKECLKAGGTWEKGAPGHTAAAKTPPPPAQ